MADQLEKVKVPRKGEAFGNAKAVSETELFRFKKRVKDIRDREMSYGKVSIRSYRAAYHKWITMLGMRPHDVSDTEIMAEFDKYCIPIVFKMPGVKGVFLQYEKVTYRAHKDATEQNGWHPNHVVFNYPLWLENHPNWYSEIKRKIDSEGEAAENKTKNSRRRF